MAPFLDIFGPWQALFSQDSTITVKTGDKEISILIAKARNCKGMAKGSVCEEFGWNFDGISGSKSGQSMSKQLVNVAYCDKRVTYFSLSITTIIQVDVQNTDTPTPTTAQGDQHWPAIFFSFLPTGFHSSNSFPRGCWNQRVQMAIQELSTSSTSLQMRGAVFWASLDVMLIASGDVRKYTEMGCEKVVIW